MLSVFDVEQNGNGLLILILELPKFEVDSSVSEALWADMIYRTSVL